MGRVGLNTFPRVTSTSVLGTWTWRKDQRAACLPSFFSCQDHEGDAALLWPMATTTINTPQSTQSSTKFTPPSSKVIKFENVRVLRDGKLRDEYFWVDNGKVIDPQSRFWQAHNQRECEPDEIIDGKGCIISPGFIDVQINGGYGVDFTDPTISKEDIATFAKKVVATGTTAFLPTIVSSAKELYHHQLPKFDRTSDGHVHKQANILGLHLEGPFINPERKGAHDERVLRDFPDGVKNVIDVYGGEEELKKATIITLAPGKPKAMEVIRDLTSRGIIVSAGHSLANIDEGTEAVKNGATMVTHMFNAMAPFHHRDPGLIGLLGLRENRPYFGVIMDEIHCHAVSARIVQCCHPKGLVLVTDAMAGMGLDVGTYHLGNGVVHVENHRAVIDGTNTIAGSVATMDSCVRKMVECTACSVEEALEAATLHPARVLGIEHQKGSLSYGCDADFVLLDNDLNVMSTYIAGEKVFDRQHTQK